MDALTFLESFLSSHMSFRSIPVESKTFAMEDDLKAWREKRHGDQCRREIKRLHLQLEICRRRTIVILLPEPTQEEDARLEEK